MGKDKDKNQIKSSSISSSISHSLTSSHSLAALRLTEIMEWSMLCGESDSIRDRDRDVPVPSMSLGRSLGGLFGLGGSSSSGGSSSGGSGSGTGDITTVAGHGSGSGSSISSGNNNVSGLDAYRLSQMRVALCPIKIQFALQLADLGYLSRAAQYAKEAKAVLTNARQGNLI